MKMPRFSDVENLPPYHVTQLNAFRRSTSFHGSSDPMIVTGKLTVWKATLSLPMNCTYVTSFAPLSVRHQRSHFSLAWASPLGSLHPTVAPIYSIGASNQT